MSDITELSDTEEVDKQLNFVRALKEHKVIFNNSQEPQIKNEKESALQALTAKYDAIFHNSLTTKQIDLSRTGNKRISYKPWENMLIDLLDAEKNPVVAKIPGTTSAGINDLPLPENSTTSSSLLKRKSCSLPETDETKNLNNSELQRLVLLEQLELIRIQKQRETMELEKAKKELQKPEEQTSDEKNKDYEFFLNELI
ncbi:uncharacterized protein [Eurosta solidaginis]|uniref:uncharacterized protein n=1 Tax=Eurosta solidaginis TaxID=178769 RepID=UPI003530DDA8